MLRGGGANTVNLRLVETATRAQVWAGRTTLQDTDIASESSVALRGVTNSLLNALITAEEQRVKTQPISALGASELVLRAFALGGEDPSLFGLRGAGKLVDEALLLQPDLVTALVLRAALLNNENEVDPNADPGASPATRTDIRRGPCSSTRITRRLGPGAPLHWDRSGDGMRLSRPARRRSGSILMRPGGSCFAPIT